MDMIKIAVRIDKATKKAEEVRSISDGAQRIVVGSRFHAAFKYGGDAATSHPILHDRKTFVVLWVAGMKLPGSVREAAWLPATWGLFTLEGLSDAGDAWMAELSPVMHWSVSDAGDPLGDLYASDFGDSY